MTITLSDAKHHLNIEEEYTGDDRYIETLVKGATAAVAAMAQRDMDALTEEESDIARQAVLLIVGEWYMQREDSVVGAAVNRIPNGVERLVHAIKSYSGRR